MQNTSRIRFRALEPSDIDTIFQWENDLEVCRVSEEKAPISKFKLEVFIQQSLHLDIYGSGQLRLMVVKNDKKKSLEAMPIGTIDFFDFEPSHKRVGIGILIDKAFRNQGYGAETLQASLKFAFEELQVHQVYANIAENNYESIRLFDSCGFVKCGEKADWIFREGIYIHEHMYQYIRKD